MCGNCVTAMEATVVQSAGAAVIAQQLWHRLRDFAGGRHPAWRAHAVYDRNRAFVESLGLDGAAVLGDRPQVPATDPTPAPVRVRTRRPGELLRVG